MRRFTQGARHRVKLTLNGRECEGQCEPRTLLSDFLRQELGAIGVHVGCEHGICGACTVRIDGVAQRTCLALAVSARARMSKPWKGSPTLTERCPTCRRHSGVTMRCNAGFARRGS